MSIAIGEDHLALLDTVRRFTTSRCDPKAVRAAVDADVETLPPFWDDLAALGWLGLHLPEGVGGEGYGFVELAVVLEELGRVLAPGPFLPTVFASAAIHAGGGSTDLLRGLAAGRTIGTVAYGSALGSVAGADGTILVTGSTGPVLCGSLADVVVAPVVVDGTQQWCTLTVADAEVTALDALDPTRGLASFTFSGAMGAVLPTLDRSKMDVIAATLISAECRGWRGVVRRHRG